MIGLSFLFNSRLLQTFNHLLNLGHECALSVRLFNHWSLFLFNASISIVNFAITVERHLAKDFTSENILGCLRHDHTRSILNVVY